tara:strand:+ start:136 stop:471 length:336 start_codon:yes stop_codon:yes gene_type:complete
MAAYVYMLRCRDGSYYVGSTRGSLEHRINEHNQGTFRGYTWYRRPVILVYHQEFERIEDAISAERKLKGWSRAKKEALIRGDFEEIRRLARRKGTKASFDTRASLAAQDEE